MLTKEERIFADCCISTYAGISVMTLLFDIFYDIIHGKNSYGHVSGKKFFFSYRFAILLNKFYLENN